MKLSIVVPHINEEEALNATIRSIRATAGDRVEIVVVDDCSCTPPKVIGADIVIVNRQRCGTGPSRHIGAEAATGTHILITDCHMTFTERWYDNYLLTAFPNGGALYPGSVYCGVCLALDDDHRDVNRPMTTYHGATFNFYGPDKQKPDKMQILEGVWAPRRQEVFYEIPCLMGACYFVNREWYLKLSPHKHLREWGVEEQALSLKTWLAGGKIYQCNNIRIGHKFRRDRKRLPFRLKTSSIIYNKLFVMFTCLPEEYARALMKKFPREVDFNLAYQALRDNWNLVETEQARNRNLFTVSFDWLLAHWGLTCPKVTYG